MRRSRNAIPKAIKIKKPKLDPSGLREAYGWLPYSKDFAFGLALSWYSTNTAALLFNAPLTADQLITYSKGQKAATLAEGASLPNEREQANRTAIRCYEKIWQEKHTLPKLNEDIVPAKANRKVASMVGTLSTLNAAFAPLNLNFAPTAKAEREVNGNTVEVPISELSELSSKNALGAVFAEFVSAAKSMALTPKADGSGMMVDGQKLFNEAIPKVLNGILAWAETVPQRELFKAGANPAPGQPVKSAPPQAVPARPMPAPKPKPMPAPTPINVPPAAPAAPRAPRPAGAAGTSKVVSMIQQGATMDQMIAATGLLPHSIRSFISTYKRKHGLTVQLTGKVYRIV